MQPEADYVVFMSDWFHDEGNAMAMRLNRYVEGRGRGQMSREGREEMEGVQEGAYLPRPRCK